MDDIRTGQGYLQARAKDMGHVKVNPYTLTDMDQSVMGLNTIAGMLQQESDNIGEDGERAPMYTDAVREGLFCALCSLGMRVAVTLEGLIEQADEAGKPQ